MTTKKRLAVMLLAFVLGISAVITAAQVTVIAKAKSTITYTNVLEDLQRDSSFSKENYPEKETDYSLQIIQLAESSDKELFVYVYQPSGQLKGLTEQTKCKWKVLLELCATFDYMYVKFFGEELRYRLLDLHGQVQELRNINKEYDLGEAYQVYYQIYKYHCDRDKFNENFKQPLGYLIDQKGSVPSLTKVVCEFIKKFENKNESCISGERAMLLDYI